MTIQILNEISIYSGEAWEQRIVRLWLVEYGHADREGHSPGQIAFVEALAAFCRSQGWILQCEPAEPSAWEEKPDEVPF
ncbi:MAG: hypothetical protein AAF702_38110 [Chloroflexota bacterium]